ncbi:Peroxisome biogenesis factor 2 [Orchesella cincta]|uniref:RING-type E3 ubiquitin transferase (cysteine targeting) n=1 Tax=Orchesella cincta TaxID=48709 RepID=A0A1D2N722_ORCCI|nr:Peroxisome biogenesis factor 2 [Orchesella cincta]
MIDFASRIAKLDAVSLDNEFLSFFKREATGLLGAFTREELLQKFGPEVTLLIKFLVWKFTTLANGSTIGQRLLGVKYAPFRGKLKLLFLLEGVIPYVIERLQTIPYLPLERIRQPLKRAESVLKLLRIFNFCAFLIQNRYPTLATRVLKLPILPVHHRFSADAGYSYQIRELLWHQFADFLIMVLPMVNFQKAKRSVLKWISCDKPVVPESVIRQVSDDDIRENRTVLKCCICTDDAVLPQKVGGESYCYYCYQTVAEDD